MKYAEDSKIYKYVAKLDDIKEIYDSLSGEYFYIRKLSVKDYEPINRAMMKQETAAKEGKQGSLTELIKITISIGLCDENGTPVVDVFSQDVIEDFDNRIATLLYKEIIEFNNPDFAEIKKNIM